jgi:hypothetical protein
MLEDNQMKDLVKALNEMPHMSRILPNHLDYTTDRYGKSNMARIRHILGKAIAATDKPYLYKITTIGDPKKYVILRDDRLPKPLEGEALEAYNAEMEKKRVIWQKERDKEIRYIRFQQMVGMLWDEMENNIDENNE